LAIGGDGSEIAYYSRTAHGALPQKRNRMKGEQKGREEPHEQSRKQRQTFGQSGDDCHLKAVNA